MFNKIKYKLFIKKLNLIISNNKFLNKLNQLITEIQETNNSSFQYTKYCFSESITWTNDNNDRLIISIDGTEVQFVYYTNNNTNNQFGKIYKKENNKIIRYDHSIIETDDDLIYTVFNKDIISIFNNQDIEVFRSDLDNCEQYKIKSGNKIHVSNNEKPFYNNLKITKKIRTNKDSIISFRKQKYYCADTKKYDNVLYTISTNRHISEKYLPDFGEFSEITRDEYLAYIVNNIVENYLPNLNKFDEVSLEKPLGNKNTNANDKNLTKKYYI